ncbi:pseudouridine-metabolizing bifunctional protein C1861.05-like [Asterias rubens]|uniref:pseudouridine-metabolizing bifunctional protein C1861.05-like n=1 Tax=Asterias rubens TaxID=7604 RepID=UPI001454E987|nr:pseudouridine-metabolizing bifunctional protein C1861.05-like [Asterias rubens]XP_033640202.1 pseudouridine-metabolizing bifunctional protein C1861.05-like [Asterias rubens]
MMHLTVNRPLTTLLKHMYMYARQKHSTSSIPNDLIQVQANVASVLRQGGPVVALESTIITHGMPYPDNLRTAQEVESIIELNDATPATIALMNGKLHIGLTQSDLQYLAKSTSPVKASRRDLAWVLSKGLTGGTTVSGTMIGAHRAGIHVFVTGGIGGVHREGQTSMDVSADLTELGRTPVAVISAGVKSILDIPRTLEYLETEGVTVATFGPSRDFPAFFLPSSGYQAPINVTSAREAAELIDYSLSLELGSGLLIGVPIPSSVATQGQQIEDAIQSALQQASVEGIHGKDVTPFILQRVNELTGGESLKANIALIQNNARVGSKIAQELSYIRRDGSKRRHVTKTTEPTAKYGQPVVIGGSNVDLVSSIRSQNIQYGDGTNPGSVHITLGGVGRNIADCLSRLGTSPMFLSAIGRDSQGDTLLGLSSHMNTSAVSIIDDHSTATYSCVLDSDGAMVLGVGDMDVHVQITPEYVSGYEKYLSSAPLVCIDGNIPVDTIEYVCKYCAQHNTPVWYEPTCIVKSTLPFQSDCWKTISYISPNFKELCMISNCLHKKNDAYQDHNNLTVHTQVEICIELCELLLQHMYCVVVTLGQHGILVCRNAQPEEPFLIASSTPQERTASKMSVVHYPACNADHITSVSGAGDCLAGAMIARILQQSTPDDCIKSGLLAALCSTQTYLTVPASVSTIDELLDSTICQPNRIL